MSRSKDEYSERNHEPDIVVDTSSEHSLRAHAVSENDKIVGSIVAEMITKSPCRALGSVGSSSSMTCSEESAYSWGGSTPDADDSSSNCSVVVDCDEDCVIIETIIRKKNDSNNMEVSSIAPLSDPLKNDNKIIKVDKRQPLKLLQNRILREPRRNPKRQAKQLNNRRKRFESMFEFCTTKARDERLRRSSRRLNNLNHSAQFRQALSAVGHGKKYRNGEIQYPPRKKARPSCQPVSSVTTRASSRRQEQMGSIQEKPDSDDEWEVREWPVEGLHERPVWPDPRYPPPENAVGARRRATPLERSIHESLHLVLAFCAHQCREQRVLSGAGDFTTRALGLQTLATNISNDLGRGDTLSNCDDVSETGNIILKYDFPAEMRKIASECSKMLATNNDSSSALGSGDHFMYSNPLKTASNILKADALRQDNNERTSLCVTSNSMLGAESNKQAPSNLNNTTSSLKLNESMFGALEGSGDGHAVSPIDLTNRRPAECDVPLDLTTLSARKEDEGGSMEMCSTEDHTAFKIFHDSPLDFSTTPRTTEYNQIFSVNDSPVDLTLVSSGERTKDPQESVTSSVEDSREAEPEPMEGLEKLIHSTLLLYCTVCSVPQKDLAEYIDTLTVGSLNDWLHEAMMENAYASRS